MRKGERELIDYVYIWNVWMSQCVNVLGNTLLPLN